MDKAALEKLYLALATGGLENWERVQGQLLPTPECLPLARCRDALLREDWTEAEAAHKAGCRYCQKTEARLRTQLWHPGKAQLFWYARRLPAGEDGADVAYHLEQDRCRRCLQLSALLAPRVLRLTTAFALAASILFLFIGLRIGSSSRLLSENSVAQAPDSAPLYPREAPQTSPGPPETGSPVPNRGVITGAVGTSPRPSEPDLGLKAFSIIKLDKGQRAVPAKGWLAMNDYGTFWLEKDVAMISYYVAQDDKMPNNGILKDGLPHHYRLLYVASVSVQGTTDEGWWYQAPGSFGVIVCYKEPTHLRPGQPTYPLYYTVDGGNAFFRWIADGGTIGLAAADNGKSATRARLHALIVADTLADPTNERGFQKDAWNVERVFKEAFEDTEQDPKRSDRLKIKILKGEKVSPKDIREYYKSLDVKADDTVVFYYSGHGGWDRKQRQFLRMTQGDLLRTELLRMMKDKTPRLLALMTDCCSTQSRYKGMPVAGAPRGNWDIVRRLFLEPRGVVDINAAQEGKPAYGDVNGGVFTNAFTNLLCGASERIEDHKVSWVSLKSTLIEQTQEEFKRLTENLKTRGTRLDEEGLGVQKPSFITLPPE